MNLDLFSNSPEDKPQALNAFELASGAQGEHAYHHVLSITLGLPFVATTAGLLYWNAATVAAMHVVRGLRAPGVPVFLTIDAGPQLKAVCLPSAAATVAAALREVPGVLNVVETGLGGAARLIPVAELAAA